MYIQYLLCASTGETKAMSSRSCVRCADRETDEHSLVGLLFVSWSGTMQRPRSYPDFAKVQTTISMKLVTCSLLDLSVKNRC